MAATSQAAVVMQDVVNLQNMIAQRQILQNNINNAILGVLRVFLEQQQ